MELMFAEWEDGERFSFEDSDHFEEDSLCSFISEAESLCQNWRGWRKQSAGPNSPTVKMKGEIAWHPRVCWGHVVAGVWGAGGQGELRGAEGVRRRRCGMAVRAAVTTGWDERLRGILMQSSILDEFSPVWSQEYRSAAFLSMSSELAVGNLKIAFGNWSTNLFRSSYTHVGSQLRWLN